MKTGKGFKAFCALMAILVILSAAMGFVNYFGQKKLLEQSGEADDVNREDGVTIANEYKIESTLKISDAYRNEDTSKLDDREKETLEMAKKVIASEINSDMNAYKKEYAIYKYLTSKMKNDTGLLTVIPNSSADSDNPYGTLKNHTAVCVGYATTFRMFMQMLGIECKVVHSTDLTHTWDLVKLKDEWYHVDCYMDAETGNNRNFNATDEMFAESHEWNRDFFPAANGTEFNPMITGAKEIKDIYAIPGWLRDNIDKETESFSCKFKDGIKEEDERSARYIVETIINSISWDDTNGFYLEYQWVKDSQGNYILCVFRSNNGDDLKLSDDEQNAADEAIAEFFPDIQPEDFEGYGEDGGNGGYSCDY